MRTRRDTDDWRLRDNLMELIISGQNINTAAMRFVLSEQRGLHVHSHTNTNA